MIFGIDLGEVAKVLGALLLLGFIVGGVVSYHLDSDGRGGIGRWSYRGGRERAPRRRAKR